MSIERFQARLTNELAKHGFELLSLEPGRNLTEFRWLLSLKDSDGKLRTVNVGGIGRPRDGSLAFYNVMVALFRSGILKE